jgi:hypothetical protein
MKFIKVYGERNSGTIYLEWLMKNNLEVVIADTFDLGWKHRLAPEEDELSEKLKEEIIFICLVKNPYSWLLSMHTRPYQHEVLKNLNFSDFIRYSYGDYRNPVTMWNAKYNSYLRLAGFVKNFIWIRYEDLLTSPEASVRSIAAKFELQRKDVFRNIHRVVTNSHGIKKVAFHKDYYTQEAWKKKYNTGQVEHINLYLDPNLMEKFNYSYL